MTREFYREEIGHYHALATNPKEHEVTSYMTKQNYFNT